jgi:ubiquinone/menaquinone biosynthesis C-methylase UbiE
MKIEQERMEKIFWSIDEVQQPLSDLEAELLAALLKHLEGKLNQGFKKVLDVACGWGRHHRVLRKRGFEVHGVDLNQLFIERARKLHKGFEDRYRVGDIRSLPYQDESFDVVLSFFTSFGYFDDGENEKCLREMHRVLRKGGVLILETLNRVWAKYNFVPIYAQGVGEEFLLLNRGRWQENFWVWKRVLYERETMKKLVEKEMRLRFYSREELDKLAGKLGYEPIMALSGLSARPFKPSSQRMLLVYRK